MSTIKLMLPAVLTASIAGPMAASAAETKAPQPPASTGVRVPFLHGFLSGEVGGQSKLTSLARANDWLNSPPLTASALRGKVALVQVWTYTCINWLRTLPYVRAWAEKYRDQGLVVIGVHAPEFSFERNIDNVRRAAKEMKIGYPIAIDNDYAIWRAFKNQYWPALYFVDAHGRVRHHHFGEGAYQQSEMTIQALLAEAGGGASATDRKPVSVDPQGIEAAADWSRLRSMIPIYWNLVFTALNIYWICRLVLERLPVKLSADEQRLCELVFRTMTPREMIRLLKLATWESAEAGECFVERGKPLDRLMVIYSGKACAEIDGRDVTELQPGHFIGSISYVTE